MFWEEAEDGTPVYTTVPDDHQHTPAAPVQEIVTAATCLAALLKAMMNYGISAEVFLA